MKPNFALNLTHDSIGLLHRTSRGWLEVGNAAIDAPDLGEALTYLRKSALGLSPAGFTTKLVIPSSQILYDEVEAPGPTDTKRRNQIKKALEGRTPYAVDDLVFDWCGDGPMVKVAVVARETLEEAEQFAAQHKFNAVSFVAIPDADAFDGEPFFGKAAKADGWLQPGEKVERDPDAVTIVAGEMPRAEAPVAPPPDVAEVEDFTAGESPDNAAPADIREPFKIPEDLWPELAIGTADATAGPEALSDPETLPVIAEVPSEPPVADARSIEPVAEAAVPEAPRLTDDAAPQSASESDSDPVEPDPVAVTKAARDDEASPVFADADIPPEEPTERAMGHEPRLDEVEADEADAPVALDVEPLSDETKPEIAPIAPTFTSRRQTPGAEGADSQPTPPLKSGFPVPATKVALPGAKPKVGLPPPPPPKFVKPIAGKVTAPGIVGLSAERRAKLTSPITDPRNATAARNTNPPMSPTMGLGSRAAPKRGRPRFLGLILTGILLLLLAMVAAWSSFYLASSGEEAVVETASAPAVSVEPDGSIMPPPAIEDEMLADAQNPADFVGAVDGVTESDLLEADLPDDPPPPFQTASVPVATAIPAAEADLTPQARPVPVASGTGGQAPIASSDTQDEIFLATIDAPPLSQGALVLPGPEAGPENVPPAQLAPPPFGTQYQFDSLGRIQPTVDGIVTPDGITLFSGRPIKEPPPRPAALRVATANGPPLVDPAGTIPTTPPDPEAAAPAALSVASDPALAGSRPRGRPEDLVPAATAPAPDPDDAAVSLPPTAADIRLASSRPRARPAGVIALGTTAQGQTAAASIAAVAGNGPVSPLALAISARPAPRPGNFSKAVEAAVAAAVRDAPPEPVAEATPDPAPAEEPTRQATLRVRKPTPADEPTVVTAPEADSEPEDDGGGARVASSGTVAKRATFANAINLSKVNLIGVYGTSNARYALIRQSNGRYKKVKVGDRFDGGTVAAITASEVRYQKSGRIYALTLPTG